MVLDHLVIQSMNDSVSSSQNPYNKESLAAILKFGAKDLFKEDDSENKGSSIEEMSIDEILERAETAEDDVPNPGHELLSAFKVATYSSSDLDDPDFWKKTIPESALKEHVDEEKKAETLPLRRATLKQFSFQEEDDVDLKKYKKSGKDISEFAKHVTTTLGKKKRIK